MRDEQYVLDLCDEVLGSESLRQHRFNWLTGDTGIRLPVDAYYPELKLVIEYRERQHQEPGPKLWNKPTISGMRRDEQRRKYDELRDVEIPANGFRLVVITLSQLDSTSRGRLRRRDRDADLVALRIVLRDAGFLDRNREET